MTLGGRYRFTLKSADAGFWIHGFRIEVLWQRGNLDLYARAAALSTRASRVGPERAQPLAARRVRRVHARASPAAAHRHADVEQRAIKQAVMSGMGVAMLSLYTLGSSCSTT